MVLLQAIHKLTEYLSFQVKNVARELVDAFDRSLGKIKRLKKNAINMHI